MATHSQFYQTQEQKPDHYHAWRTETPNLIWELNLGAYGVTIYLFLKKIAGDNGLCFMSRENIAEKCGCCVRTLDKFLKFLSSPFQKLNGKSLILIKDGVFNNKGSQQTNQIIITDIWRENGDFYRNLEKVKKNINGVHEMQGEGAGDAHKEEEDIKNNISLYNASAREPVEEFKEKPQKLDIPLADDGLPVVQLSAMEIDALTKHALESKITIQEAQALVNKTIREYRLYCGANNQVCHKPYFALLKWIDAAIQKRDREAKIDKQRIEKINAFQSKEKKSTSKGSWTFKETTLADVLKNEGKTI